MVYYYNLPRVRRERSRPGSGEGQAHRVGTWLTLPPCAKAPRGDPITLTVGAAHVDLSRRGLER